MSTTPTPSAPMVAPNETYERREDMSPDGRLQIYVQEDGDVILTVIAPCHEEMQIASVEFCSIGSGGGKSPNTRAALLNLARAIIEDNRHAPFPS